jgi:hypothetical protein
MRPHPRCFSLCSSCLALLLVVVVSVAVAGAGSGSGSARFELGAELQHITRHVTHSPPPFCPSRPEDFENWNHTVFLTDLQLSYNKNTEQYEALSDSEKANRIVDDSDTSWVSYLCPEVKKYYSFVKYNDFYDKFSLVKKKRGRRQSNDVSMTTTAAMASTCMLRVVDIVAKQINMTWALIAGSHLGAGLHGGPIPWDDDTDIIIDITKKEAFVQGIESFQFENRTIFGIYQGTNALKMWIQHPSYTPLYNPNTTTYFPRHPFLDIFSFKRNQIVEASRRVLARKTWDESVFDHIRLYFFGGIMVPGLPWSAAATHYNTSKCIVAASSHRGRYFTYNRNHGQVFGCLMTKFYPFLYRFPSLTNPSMELEVIAVDMVPVHATAVDTRTGQVVQHGFLINGNGGLGSLPQSRGNTFVASESFQSPVSRAELLLPQHAWHSEFAIRTWGQFSTPLRRVEIKNAASAAASTGIRHQGKQFTAQIPNLNEVEVDNSIAPADKCRLQDILHTDIEHNSGSISSKHMRGLKVVTFNARRGTTWLEFVLKVRSDLDLRDPDVILLNEMDIGMSRSGNLHTTRMMAHALDMNYAWGLEFLELTNGNKEEQVLFVALIVFIMHSIINLGY